jgi:hypothetical protein
VHGSGAGDGGAAELGTGNRGANELGAGGQVLPTRREEGVRGNERGAAGDRLRVQGPGCVAVHLDARSDGRSVEGGVHVQFGARRAETGCTDIRALDTSKRIKSDFRFCFEI